MTDEIRNEASGKFIQLKEGKVRYQLHGPDSAELIIFIHGGGIAGDEVWMKNAPYFEGHGYQTLSFDLYDRGYSDRVLIENSPELFFSQLTQLLDALQLKHKRAHLVSMSLGAIIAIDYTVANPDQIDKLVMIDPMAAGDFQTTMGYRLPLLSEMVLAFRWYPRAIGIQENEFVDKQQFIPYAERLRYFMSFKGYKRTTRSTWMYMLSRNKIPELKNMGQHNLLLLYGNKDPYFKESDIAAYRRFYPTLLTGKINEAGHLPHWEKSAEVNRAILDFLKN